jgi:hypothetical protein
MEPVETMGRGVITKNKEPCNAVPVVR